MLATLKWLLSGASAGLFVGLVGVVLLVTPIGLEFERDTGLSSLFKFRGANEPPSDVAVVGINSRTGGELGLSRLPQDWSREIHGRLTRALREAGAAVIVFDFDFSRTRTDGGDDLFAEALREAGDTILYERLMGRREPIQLADGSVAGWSWIEERIPPATPFAASARAFVPFPLPKVDQAAHQFWTFKASAGDVPTVASMAMQLVLLGEYETWRQILEDAGAPGLDGLPEVADGLTGNSLVRMVTATREMFIFDADLEARVLERITAAFETGEIDAQRASKLEALASLYGGDESRFINFFGPPGTVPTISYQDALDLAQNDPGRLANLVAGRVVFVGYSDLFNPDQPDRFYSAFTNDQGIDLSGVEIMATSFANLMNDSTIRPLSPELSLAHVFLFGLVVATALYLLPSMYGVPLVLLLAGAGTVLIQYLFETHQIWVPVAIPLLVQLPLAIFIGLLTQYLLHRQRDRRMTAAMSYYVPADVLESLSQGSVDATSANKVVYGICLASDMSGFTKISEGMTPDQLAKFMNSYFDGVAQALKRHHVDVTEFHADTIMCAWTGEEGDPSKRRHALLAAVEVQKQIQAFAKEHEGLGLKARIGMQDGRFYLGHTGGGGRMAYSILGDPANTAARLESLNKHLGTRLLAAKSITEGIDDLVYRPLGSYQFVGKSDVTEVVEILGLRGEQNGATLRIKDLFEAGIGHLRADEPDKAGKLFLEALSLDPQDGPAKFLLAACNDNDKDQGDVSLQPGGNILMRAK